MNKISKKYLMYSYFVFLLIIIMTYYIISKINLVDGLNNWVIITFLINGGISVINIIRDNKPFSLNKIFWYFNFFFLFLSPLIQYLSGYKPWNFYISDDILLKSNLLISVWIIIYMFVNMIMDSKHEIQYKNRYFYVSKNEIKNMILFSIASIVLLIVFIGFGNLFVRQSNYIELGDDLINSLVSKFLRSIPIFGTTIYILMREKNKCKKNRLLLLIFISLTIVANFPSSISRYWIGTVYIGLLLLFLKDKIKNRSFDFLLIFVITVVFPFFTLFKRNDLLTVLNGNIFLPIEQVFNNVDFDAYSMFARIIIYTKTFGFEYGHQLICTLFFFIPRSIWHNKPFPTGVMVATKQNVFYTNLSSPLISEAYVDFGIIGVFVYAIIISYVISFLDNKYWKKKESNSINLLEIIYPFLLGFLLFLLRGSMQPVVTHAFSFFLFIFLKYFLTNKKKRRDNNESTNN